MRSPHPSVAALYHFTREVCTPASAHASHRPALSSTPTECADLVRRLEGALDEHTSESGGGYHSRMGLLARPCRHVCRVFAASREWLFDVGFKTHSNNGAL